MNDYPDPTADHPNPQHFDAETPPLTQRSDEATTQAPLFSSNETPSTDPENLFLANDPTRGVFGSGEKKDRVAIIGGSIILCCVLGYIGYLAYDTNQRTTVVNTPPGQNAPSSNSNANSAGTVSGPASNNTSTPADVARADNALPETFTSQTFEEIVYQGPPPEEEIIETLVRPEPDQVREEVSSAENPLRRQLFETGASIGNNREAVPNPNHLFDPNTAEAKRLYLNGYRQLHLNKMKALSYFERASGLVGENTELGQKISAALKETQDFLAHHSLSTGDTKVR